MPKFRRLIPFGTSTGTNIGLPSAGSVVRMSQGRKDDPIVSLRVSKPGPLAPVGAGSAASVVAFTLAEVGNATPSSGRVTGGMHSSVTESIVGLFSGVVSVVEAVVAGDDTVGDKLLSEYTSSIMLEGFS